MKFVDSTLIRDQGTARYYLESLKGNDVLACCIIPKYCPDMASIVLGRNLYDIVKVLNLYSCLYVYDRSKDAIQFSMNVHCTYIRGLCV